MNTRELYLARQDVLKMIAIMQPELAKELAAMKVVEESTQKAARIVGTQKDADALHAAAKEALAAAETKAFNSIAEATRIRELASASAVEVDEKTRALREETQRLSEATAAHKLAIRQHEAENAQAHSDLQKQREALAGKCVEVAEWEAKVRELKDATEMKLRKMREIV